MQSAYKPCLKVQNDTLLEHDKGQCVFLPLQDLLAASDMVDIDLLLNLSESCLGASNSRLKTYFFIIFLEQDPFRLFTTV